jgi:hypothetical protein
MGQKMTALTAAYVNNTRIEERPYQGSPRGSVFPVNRMIVDDCHSGWTRSLQNRLNELVSLQPGWDGYTGRPVSYTVAAFAAAILNELHISGVQVPSLVPGSDGTLQIEWHVNNIDIELDVLGANNVIASFYDHENDIEEELVIRSDFISVWKWLLIVADRSENIAC